MSNELYSELGAGDLEGFDRHRSRQRAEAVASAVQLVADVRKGRVPSYLLQEALQPRTPAIAYSIARNYPGIIQVQETMTRSDFPLLMGDVMDRMMLGRWREFPQPWRNYVDVTTRRDFRESQALAFDGLEGAWPEQKEEEELEYGALTEAQYRYAVRKFSLGAKLSWELVINDDLDAFNTIPDRLGRGGARTVGRFVTTLYVGASGPLAAFYSVGNANIVTGNPVLSIEALQLAYTILRSRTDADGEPIMMESVWLVVPPALEVTARNILQSAQVVITTTTGELQGVSNWIGSSLNLAVDPYIPVIASTANGNTSWFLFADPGLSRPALQVAFLRGFEEPTLYQKIANTARIGGGIDQEAGDFNTMASEYKGVLAFGGSRLDPKSTVASSGAGA